MLVHSKMRGIALGAAIAITTASLTLVTAAPATAAANNIQATYWASPIGSGSTCSSDSPCSLEGARDKVRTVNADMTGDIIVSLTGGTYNLSSAFELTESSTDHDSGTNGFDVIYRAAEGATPILSGGTTIDPSAFVKGDGDIWSAPVAADVESRQFYVDGVRQTRARHVGNPGFSSDATGYSFASAGAPWNEMDMWGNPDDIEIAAALSWKHPRYSVDSIDVTGNAVTLTMDNPGWADSATQPLHVARDIAWVENALELLDLEGEWYLDRTADRLYYKPRPAEIVTDSEGTRIDPAREFVLGTTVGLLKGTGETGTPLHHVRFEGITFSYDGWTEPNTELGYPDFQAGVVFRGTGSGWPDKSHLTPAGVTFTNSRNIVVSKCTFEHMANAGLAFGIGSQDNLIDHNTFRDLSGSGMTIGGVTKAEHSEPDPERRVTGNVISHNTITQIGREYRDTVGIFVGFTDATDVKHNTLYDLPYSAISVGWGWGNLDKNSTNPPVAKNNIVRGNLIHDYMKQVPDGGGVYTLGSQYGTQVVDNYIYDQRTSHALLYRDNGSAGILDTNNVLDRGPNAKWYHLASGYSGNLAYLNSSSNRAKDNYFAAGMTTQGEGGNNEVTGNISVSGGNWPADALEVIAAAGVDGADISNVAPVPASQGKATTASTSSVSHPASNAVDGDSATRWAQASGAADPSWLKVDLGETHVVTGVTTSAFLATGEGVKYRIEYSTDDVVWTTYADHTTKFVVPGKADGPAVNARYVRMLLTDTQLQEGSLWEFEVWGSPLSLSQGKPATASSQYSENHVPGKAVDGLSTTRWAQHSGYADPSWLQVDLGADYVIARTTTSTIAAQPVKYKIEYSADGSTWFTFVNHTAYAIPGTDTSPTTAIGRYVRVTFTATQGQGGSVSEFDVYGDPITRLTAGATATASSIYSPTFSADKALDLNAATRWAQSAGAADPSWLQVDLGSAQDVAHVATSAFPVGSAVKYKIEYSTDGSTWSTFVAKTAAFSAPGIDSLTTPVSARYVKITITGSNGQGGSIREFQVYGG